MLAGPEQCLAGGLIDATDPDAVLAVLRGQAEGDLLTDGMGDPVIAARAGDTGFRGAFYGCEGEGGCTTLMFTARWEVDEPDADRMAGWNREKRFGKAWLDADDAPTLEMDANLEGGVSRANLESTVARWLTVLKEFIDFNGF
jgi:hypothetical protein